MYGGHEGRVIAGLFENTYSALWMVYSVYNLILHSDQFAIKMAGDEIDINELLCWVINMISVLTSTQLMQYATQKFSETDIKEARDLLYKRVITDKERPEFGKRVSHKPGDSKSMK